MTTFLKIMKSERLLIFLAAILSYTSCDSPENLLPDDGNSTETPTEPENPEDPDDPSEPEQPEATHYALVDAALSDWSGEYLITFTDTDRILVFGDWDESAYGQPAKDTDGDDINFKNVLEAEGIPAEDGDPYRTVITKVGNYYSVNVSNVGYIGYTGGRNALAHISEAPGAEDTEYLWEITYGTDVWLTNAASDDRRLQWNNSAPRFSTYTGSQEELTLYRKSGNTDNPDPGDPDEPGEPTDPEEPTDPDPEEPTDPASPNDVGWFELPVITDENADGIKDDDNTLYYAYHLCEQKGEELYRMLQRRAPLPALGGGPETFDVCRKRKQDKCIRERSENPGKHPIQFKGNRRRLQQGTHARFCRTHIKQRNKPPGLLLYQHSPSAFKHFQHRRRSMEQP